MLRRTFFKGVAAAVGGLIPVFRFALGVNEKRETALPSGLQRGARSKAVLMDDEVYMIDSRCLKGAFQAGDDRYK